MPSITNSSKNSEVSADSFLDYFSTRSGRWHLLFEMLGASAVFSVVIVLAQAGSWLKMSIGDILSYFFYMGWTVVAFVAIVDYYHHELNQKTQKQVLVYSFILLQLIVISTTSLLTILWSALGLGWKDFISRISHQLSLDLSYSIFLGGFCLHYIYIKNQWLNKRNSELKYRVQAMQARIHPHFLFNSLNSAVSLIAIDPDKAETMLIDLSRLFRASFQELKLVSLQEEIKLCQHYLAIEQIRLGERLTVNWKILAEDLQLLKVRIPLLTLQPLLENSILHGIEKIGQAGTISILVEVMENQVNIVISNPFQPNPTPKRREHNGIAVENVRQRLQMYYGQSLKFLSYQGEMTYTTVIQYRDE